MPCGRIIKALSGYYYVLPESLLLQDSNLVQCRARGLFRKTGESPLVGDLAQYELRENQEGMVMHIAERKNSLIRPPIANVDQVILVFSFDEPEFNSLLLDRFLVHIEYAQIPVLICLSKSDLIQAETFDEIVMYYQKIGYTVMITSAKKEEGIELIRDHLRGKISVFAGQSGVGKSSLLNALIPDKQLKTSEISHRLGRGKHTTRHVELLEVAENSLVADTPGFSQLDFDDMEPEDLPYTFLEMRERMSQCKFRGCLHDREPGCMVRDAVQKKEIHEARYQHYLQFLSEVREAKQRRY